MRGVGPDVREAASDESNADWLPATGAGAALLPVVSTAAWAAPPDKRKKALNASASLVLISRRPIPRVELEARSRHVSAGDLVSLDAAFGPRAGRRVHEVE